MRRPSLPLVLSFMALCISLGGTSYAVIKLPAKSVGSRELKPRAVTKSKVARSAVDSARVANRSLAISDLNPRAVTALRGAKGDAGPPGLRGPEGAGIRFAFAQVATGETTTATDETDLATPGPEVRVVVPPSGLIEIFAAADIQVSGGGFGVVTLTEDGVPMPGVRCLGDEYGGILMAQGMTPGGRGNIVYTAPGPNNAAAQCSSAYWQPGALMVATTPGPHTYRLKYEIRGATSATFYDRRLWIAPRP